VEQDVTEPAFDPLGEAKAACLPDERVAARFCGPGSARLVALTDGSVALLRGSTDSPLFPQPPTLQEAAARAKGKSHR